MGGVDGEGAVRNAPVPIIVYGADGALRWVNDAAVAAVDADAREQLVGRAITDFVASSDTGTVEERFRRVIEDREQVPPRELALRTVDGERWYAEVAGGPVTYDGDPAGQAILQDVTDRRVREGRLRAERDRFTALFDSVPEPVVITDLSDGTPVVRGVNPAFEETFGYDAEAAVGEDLNDLIVPDDRLERARELDRAAADLRSVERELRRETADGDLRDFLFRARPLASSDGVESLGIYVDITDRKAAERELADERDRLRTLFEHIPNPIVHGEMVDGDPVVRRVNRAFEETFGYDAEAAVGQNLDELTVPDGSREEAQLINERIREEGEFRTEVRRETPDGLRDFVLDVVLRADDSGEGYAIYTDITEQKAREQELQRQNERLEEFAGVVSHDLRTPLSVASGNLDLYRKAGDEAYLDKVADALDHAGDLLEELLALARKGEAVDETEPVDLAETTRSAWQGADRADATLDVATEATVEADRTRLRELLANLFENAVEHGSTSSRPAGDAAEHGDGSVTVTVGDLDGAGFYVADDGPGIPPGERDDVFDPGHTTAEDGTGFGLAIVEDIAEAHGWSVALTESEAGGARFEFRFGPEPVGD